MPTITAARVKTFMSGVLGSVQDFMDGAGVMDHGEFKEDTILYQLHQKLQDKTRIHFYGDVMWGKSFGKLFTKELAVEEQDVRELDYNDNQAWKNIKVDLDHGSDFDLVIAHLDGMDHAGHAHGTRDGSVQKKMLDVESIIKKVIDNMDDDTTIVVFGDHGMTQEGSHGGSSD